MKQNILNQIKLEAKYLSYAQKIQSRVEYWLECKTMNPVELMTLYFEYINRMKYTVKYAKTIHGQFKVKIAKEPLGCENPFNIKHLRYQNKRMKCE